MGFQRLSNDDAGAAVQIAGERVPGAHVSEPDAVGDGGFEMGGQLQGREQALEPFGWRGPRRSRFALVCLHSGVFTRAQAARLPGRVPPVVSCTHRSPRAWPPRRPYPASVASAACAEAHQAGTAASPARIGAPARQDRRGGFDDAGGERGDARDRAA